MMEITEEIRAWIDRNAGATELAADEYIDPAEFLFFLSGGMVLFGHFILIIIFFSHNDLFHVLIFPVFFSRIPFII